MTNCIQHKGNEDNCEFVKPKHGNKPDHGSDNEDSKKNGSNHPRDKFSNQDAQQQANDEYKHFIFSDYLELLMESS